MSLNRFDGGNFHITDDDFKRAIESDSPREAETMVALMRTVRGMDRYVYIVKSENFEVSRSVNREDEMLSVISEIDEGRSKLGRDPRENP